MISADYNDITARFLDAWDASVPTFFDLQPSTEAPTDSPWVRFYIRAGDGGPHGMGPHFTTRQGRIWLDVFVPADGGDAKVTELVDRFLAIFRNWRTNEISYRDDMMGAPFRDPNGMIRYSVSVRYVSRRAIIPTP